MCKRIRRVCDKAYLVDGALGLLDTVPAEDLRILPGLNWVVTLLS